MGRRGLLGATAVVMAALGVGALLPATESGCSGDYSVCSTVGCPHDPNRISVHFQMAAHELVTATTKACWATECVTLLPADGGADADFDADVPLVGTGQDLTRGVLIDEGDGWTRIETSVSPVKKAANGAGSLFLPANGDDYRVTVKAADGATLLDVDRSITYVVNRAPSKCNGACLSAAIAHYPGRCRAHVRRSRARTPSGSICGSRSHTMPHKRSVGTTFARLDGPTITPVDGGTPSDLRVHPDLDDYRGPLEVTLVVDAENAALADGDRYTVDVKHVAVPPTRFEATAVYETSFPNGSCDPYPCRRVRFEVP